MFQRYSILKVPQSQGSSSGSDLFSRHPLTKYASLVRFWGAADEVDRRPPPPHAPTPRLDATYAQHQHVPHKQQYIPACTLSKIAGTGCLFLSLRTAGEQSPCFQLGHSSPHGCKPERGRVKKDNTVRDRTSGCAPRLYPALASAMKYSRSSACPIFCIELMARSAGEGDEQCQSCLLRTRGVYTLRCSPRVHLHHLPHFRHFLAYGE